MSNWQPVRIVTEQIDNVHHGLDNKWCPSNLCLQWKIIRARPYAFEDVEVVDFRNVGCTSVSFYELYLVDLRFAGIELPINVGSFIVCEHQILAD